VLAHTIVDANKNAATEVWSTNLGEDELKQPSGLSLRNEDDATSLIIALVV
jgi:hypothetical protein